MCGRVGRLSEVAAVNLKSVRWGIRLLALTMRPDDKKTIASRHGDRDSDVKEGRSTSDSSDKCAPSPSMCRCARWQGHGDEQDRSGF